MTAKSESPSEKSMGIPAFFYHQITVKPVPVTGKCLAGKTALVTGSNTGVGFETSRQFLDLGLTKLILAVRNEEKGRTAAEKLSIGRTLVAGTIEVWHLDLSEYDSILGFAERTKALERLDFVILNAAISPANHILNKHTKHDECIQVNYLSTALLAILLLPIVKSKRQIQQAPSRLTIVSSEVSAWTSFKERNEVPLLPSFDKPGKVNMVDRMFVSKLLGQFFVSQLAHVVPPSVATINCCSPATCYDSEFAREHDKTLSGAVAKKVMKLYANTCSVGARMITDAAVNHGEETHGQFLSFQKLAPMAPLIYKPEGKRISDQLWKETMAELSFAHVEDILRSIGY